MAIADPDYIQITDTQPPFATSPQTDELPQTDRSHTAAVMDTDINLSVSP